MIFRWSIWGSHVSKNIDLLRFSVLSFKKYFGNNHQYIVYTDNTKRVLDYLDGGVDVRELQSESSCFFCIPSKATWMKWCPTSRLDNKQTEFHIDSDVFLLKYPEEIDKFLSDDNMKFAIMDEFFGQSWQLGAMSNRASQDTPFVNAGFFIQKAGYDISKDLMIEFKWWKNNIKESDQTWHDEQGALAIALTKYFKSGELYVLPKDKYILVGENENQDIENLEGITLLHAVYPDHPAFYKFKKYLDGLID
ncbi:MAG: hypothetical protein AB201_02025 [Parcubacteria bacterium C7867-006]|nr:MAG: hypothetical protein AB201_02025 [Parcubacteria bacterium C7867-006]